MGTASGILAETASKFLNKKNILVADINSDAVKLLKQKGYNAIKTNLFSKIKTKFDLITFNAPYLPFDPREPKSSQIATTGGKRGDEISAEFLKQAKKHINKNGKIFLLISSLTPMNKIKKFKHKIVARKKIFMEELLILEFTFS
jgi:release factor glutamine methyltransferase